MAKSIKDILEQRVAVLDGAMGTMIQREGLQEADYRGEEFVGHGSALKGNNEMLVLTRPDLIAAIHRAYLEAGADIVSTCTFGAQTISQAEYGTQHLVRRMNLAAAELARAEVDRFAAENPARECFVAGSIGPTGKTASMSPDVDDPAHRAVDFDALYVAYCEQIDALVE
ncbi:MAG: homocysteine S-methyltransferase family protein, partial [Alistipes sp.]|nr:homocysteine S-methyltransferase family protein [Alistipes sp.]